MKALWRARRRPARSGHAPSEVGSCPLCGSSEIDGEKVVVGFPYARCGGCGVWRILDENAAAPLKLVRRRRFRPPDSRIQIFGRTLSELERWTSRGRLLDVGCGRGDLLEAARRLGWEAVGVDPGEREAREARELFGLDLMTAEFGPGLFPDGSFDAVVFHHSIEHLPNPREALEAAREALRPGGVLHVATTNLRTVDRILSPEIRVSIFDPPRHRFVFSDRTLRRLVQQVGFDVVVCRPQVASFLNPVGTRVVLREEAAKSGPREEPGAAPGRKASIPSRARAKAFRLAANVARVVLPGSAVRLYALKPQDGPSS